MNLGQILNRVDLLIDNDINDISTEQKVTTINEISRQLFRKFPVPDKFYKFITEEIPYYALPEDAAADRIHYVMIDNQEYPAINPSDKNQAPYHFCMVVTDHLYIHPNSPDQTALLYYKPRHVELSASNLSAVPSFPEDYHEILVYGLAKWIAGIQRDVDMVNNFQREYDQILSDALGDLRNMGQSRIKLETRW